jgi:hypothetical protein
VNTQLLSELVGQHTQQAQILCFQLLHLQAAEEELEITKQVEPVDLVVAEEGLPVAGHLAAQGIWEGTRRPKAAMAAMAQAVRLITEAEAVVRARQVHRLTAMVAMERHQAFPVLL